MVPGRLSFGKYRGRPIGEVPDGYLRWCLANVTDLRPAVEILIRGELARRGERYADAALVLADLEETLTARVSEDWEISHEAAGQLTDHVMEAFDEVRERHGIGDGTVLLIQASHPPARGVAS